MSDGARVAQIRAYDVLGQPPLAALLALVELAAQLCQVPNAAVNLVTDSEHHSVAAVGDGSVACSRANPMCAAFLDEPESMIVPDTRLDPRFRDRPLATGELGSVRFYAASQLVTGDRTAVGTLCVFGDQPRVLSPGQHRGLDALADRVVDVLELGLRSRLLAEALTDLAGAREELRHSTEQIADFADQVSHDLRNQLTSVSMSLQMLEEQPSVVADQDAAWMVSRALRGTQRMNGLIEDLLAAAKAGNGHQG